MDEEKCVPRVEWSQVARAGERRRRSGEVVVSRLQEERPHAVRLVLYLPITPVTCINQISNKFP